MADQAAQIEACKAAANDYRSQLETAATKDEALNLAISVAEKLMQALKLSSSPEERKQLKAQCGEMMNVADQIKKNLGVELKIKLCTIEEREKAIASGKAKIWRSGWIADYPDAENFLSLFYSGNIRENSAEVNAFKYRSANYDNMFSKAVKELDVTKRSELFAKCDQIIIDESPVMPMLTDDFMIMINARVREFKTNSMEHLDFSSIFIKEPRK